MKTFKIFVKYLHHLFYIYKLKKTSLLCAMIDDNTGINRLPCLFEENKNDNSTISNQKLVLNTENLDDRISNNQSKTNDINDSTSNRNIAMVAGMASQNIGKIDSEWNKLMKEMVVTESKFMNQDYISDNGEYFYFEENKLHSQQAINQSGIESMDDYSVTTESAPIISNRNQSKTIDIHDSTSNSNIAMVAGMASQNIQKIDSEWNKLMKEMVVSESKFMNQDYISDNREYFYFEENKLHFQQAINQSGIESMDDYSVTTESAPIISNRNQSKTIDINDSTLNSNLATVLKTVQQNTEEFVSELQKTVRKSVKLSLDLGNGDDTDSFSVNPVHFQGTKEHSSIVIMNDDSVTTKPATVISNRNQLKINDVNVNASNSNLAMVQKTVHRNTEEFVTELQKTIRESVDLSLELGDEDYNDFFWETPLFIHQRTNKQISFGIAGNGSFMTELGPESSNEGIGIQSNPLKRQYQQGNTCSSKRHKELEKSESNLALYSSSSSETFIKKPEQSGTTNSIDVELVMKISPFFSKIEEIIEIIHKFRYPFVVLNSLKPRILKKKEEIYMSNSSLEPLEKRLNELKNNLIAFEPYLKLLWVNRASLKINYYFKKDNIACIKTLHDNYLKEKGDPNTFEIIKKFQAQYKITQIAIKDTLVHLSKHKYHNIVTSESLDTFESMFKDYIEPTFELKFINKDEKIHKKFFFRIKFISEKHIYFFFMRNHANYCTGFLSLLFDDRSDELMKAIQEDKKHHEALYSTDNVSISLKIEEFLSLKTHIIGICLSDSYENEGKCWDFILTDEKYERVMGGLEIKISSMRK